MKHLHGVALFSALFWLAGCAAPQNTNLGKGAAGAGASSGSSGATTGGAGGADGGSDPAAPSGFGGTGGSGFGGTSGSGFGGTSGSGFGGSGGTGANGSGFGGTAGSSGTGASSGSAGVSGGAGGATQGGPADSCPGVALTLTGSGTDPRTGSVNGDTSGMSDGADGSCAYDIGGSESVYSFTSDIAGVAHVLAGGTFDLALYARTDCGMSSSEIACADTYGSTDAMTFPVDANTTYYVFVDGSTAYDSGTFKLEVSVSQPGADAVCPGEAVSFTGTGTQDRTASVSGDTSANADAASGSCTGTGQDDAVYAFTPDIDGTMTVDLTDPGFDGGLYVRTTCGDTGSEVACSDMNNSGEMETVSFQAKAGTTYYVFVDGYDLGGTENGPFTLDAKVVPAAADDACPGETAAWTGTDPETFSASDDTSARWDDASGTCTSGAAADVVYAVTPDKDGILDLTLAPTGFDAAMYVRTTCDTTGSEIACVDANGYNTAEHTSMWATAGTTYYVFADGSSSGEAGSFKLDASLSPVKPEEKCPGATLAFSGTPAAASATGNLAQRWADYTGSCGSNNQARDAVYHVVAPQDGKMTVSLVPTGFDGVLYVRSDCLSSGAELTCQDQAGGNGTETAVIDAVSGTDYFIFVDGHDTTNGTYTLAVTF